MNSTLNVIPCQRSSRPVPPNKSLQGSVTHKVLGRGRANLVLHSLSRARVLKGTRAAPELSR